MSVNSESLRPKILLKYVRKTVQIYPVDHLVYKYIKYFNHDNLATAMNFVIVLKT